MSEGAYKRRGLYPRGLVKVIDKAKDTERGSNTFCNYWILIKLQNVKITQTRFNTFETELKKKKTSNTSKTVR